MTAVDAAGNAGEPSDDVMVAAQDVTPPSVPQGLLANQVGTTVELVWQASADDVGVITYVLIRGHFNVKGDGDTDEHALNEIRWQLEWQDPEGYYGYHQNLKGDLKLCGECGSEQAEPLGDMCVHCLCGMRSGCPAKYGKSAESCPHDWCPHGGTSPDREWG